MTAKEKLLEAFGKFRPHITGHTTAMDLFFEAITEVDKMQEEINKLRLLKVSQQRELLKAFQEFYQKGDYNDEYPFDENINRFLSAFNSIPVVVRQSD